MLKNKAISGQYRPVTAYKTSIFGKSANNSFKPVMTCEGLRGFSAACYAN